MEKDIFRGTTHWQSCGREGARWTAVGNAGGRLGLSGKIESWYFVSAEFEAPVRYQSVLVR